MAVDIHVEYAAFAYDKNKQKHVQIGRPCESLLLCKNRYQEHRTNVDVPDYINLYDVIYKSRTVTSQITDWEPIKGDE